MDKKIFRDISYGMYIVSSMIEDEKSGCVINTLCQINSVDPLISISLNKDNYTNKVIRDSKRFSVSIISNDTSSDLIGKFGYHSSKDINKFSDINYELIDNLPVINDNMCGYVICDVVNIIDCNTHDIIVAKVLNAKKISNNVPMTYKYYHEVLKGVSPKNAPTYVEEKSTSNNGGAKYRCRVCGFIYDEEKEKVRFSDLPDDWVCPLCGETKQSFEKI